MTEYLPGLIAVQGLATAPALQFQPTDLAALQAWYDASDDSTVTWSGASFSVDQWADKSGKNRHLSGTGTTKPTYSNATDRILFSNGNNTWQTLRRAADSADITTAYSVFAVAATSTANARVVDIRSASSKVIVAMGIGNANYAISLQSGSLAQAGPLNFGNGGTIVYHGRTGAAPLSYAFNGGSIAKSSVESYNTTPTTEIVLGTDGAVAGSLNGYISEVLVYNTELTNSDRQRVEGYLAWKWGLQTSLPGGHPYRYIDARYYIALLPSSVADQQLWLDAADSWNATTSVWSDKSSKGNNYSRAAGTISTTSINGINALVMSGVRATFNNGSLFQGHTNGSTVLILAQLATNTENGHLIQSNATNTTHLVWSDNNVYESIGTSVAADANRFQGVAGVPVSTRVLYEIAADPTAQQTNMLVNGSQVASRTYNTEYQAYTYSTGLVAARTYTWTGTACEMMVFGRCLSQDDRQTVEGYVAWKWGVQSLLPSVHKWKAGPPHSRLVASIRLSSFATSTASTMVVSGTVPDLTGWIGSSALMGGTYMATGPALLYPSATAGRWYAFNIGGGFIRMVGLQFSQTGQTFSVVALGAGHISSSAYTVNNFTPAANDNVYANRVVQPLATSYTTDGYGVASMSFIRTAPCDLCAAH